MNTQAKLEALRNQFEIHKMYAMMLHAEVVSGAVKERNISRGRQPTPEEAAAGMVIAYTQYSDEEKVKRTLSSMQCHINKMESIKEEICFFKKDNDANC